MLFHFVPSLCIASVTSPIYIKYLKTSIDVLKDSQLCYIWWQLVTGSFFAIEKVHVYYQSRNCVQNGPQHDSYAQGYAGRQAAARGLAV